MQLKANLLTANKNRISAFAVLFILVISLAVTNVSGSLAYLSESTQNAVNTFSPGKVTCSVDEKFDGKTKSDVKIVNDNDSDNIPAFIRATVTINWQKNGTGSGETAPVYSATSPVSGKDYSIEFARNTEWFKGSDGYYYFKNPVAPGASTGTLIASCKPIVTKPGYHLSVDIIAEAIQYSPAAAVNNSWKTVKVENGVLVNVNGGAG